jgi:hypothetical protein
MNATSPWTVAAGEFLTRTDEFAIYKRTLGNVLLHVHLSDDSFWIITDTPQKGRLGFRAAFCPGGGLELDKFKDDANTSEFRLISPLGIYTVTLITSQNEPFFRYTTTLKPKTDLFNPFWPRDILLPDSNKSSSPSGHIHVAQEGTRSGLIYFSISKPGTGSVMYLQNLTALSDYCQQTETSCGGTVGGSMPEMGFSLPPALKKPLQANKKIIISDALVVFSEEVPANEQELTKQYLDLLAKLYLQLPRPETIYHDWPEILNGGLRDLIDNPGCWSHVAGHSYLNAYVSDYETPPEIMVQLAVLLPLRDYVEWSGEKLDVMKTIREALPEFYDKKLGTIKRWLPAAEDKLKGEEEQKKPDVMDSWYLHHPLLNLSRLALSGDKLATQLFLDSINYAIKVAHHFKYEWPVFYNMKTLEIIKAETEPGKGGEKDVPGLYAHIMIQAYELTGEKKFLNEAEKAAKKLQGLGFELFYQANNTSFSAGALLRLFKITGNQSYLELSYLCLANVFKNVQLWDCNYGYGKNFPSFFALFPLSNAPYTAVYEEQEVFCAMHDYLKHAEGVEILPSISLLLAEYIRFLVYRAVYYYPTMLPKEMLSEEVKVGELDPNLWIALEDMQDGWAKCGQVGQEVYGAGNAFGILPRHFIKVPGEKFMVYTDYPKAKLTVSKDRISFDLLGNARISCKLRVLPVEDKKMPKITVKASRQGELTGTQQKGGHLEFNVYGDQKISVFW